MLADMARSCWPAPRFKLLDERDEEWAGGGGWANRQSVALPPQRCDALLSRLLFPFFYCVV